MPILAIFTGEGLTKNMYETLRKEVRWEHKHPTGGIFHAAGFDKSGNIHVADVWESVESMNEFVNGRLIPTMKRLNIPPPRVEVYPVYNVNAYPTINKYSL